MIKFTEGGFADLWGGKKSPEILSISYALQMQVARIVAAAEKTKCFSDIDKLDDETLDYFAVEMRTMYYDQSLPIEKKRAIIKNTLNWYTKGGTSSAVTELLSVVFGEGDLEEWFNYDGDPYHFRAVLPVSQGSAVGDMNLFRELIQKIKNVRSHVDELVLQEETVLKLKTTEGKYRLCPPRCGTIPMVSTGFSQDAMNLILRTQGMAGTAAMLQASEDVPAGVSPTTSTGLVSDAADVILSSAQAEGTSQMPHTGVPKTNQEGGLVK